jgi:cellulose synthase/poly-beta-1,6-N-acetylglucosamine synthase-like glycosyltransferase
MPIPGTTSVRTEKVFTKWDYPVFALLTAVSLSATLSFISYWLSFKGWLHHPVSFVASKIIFAVIILNYFGRWCLLAYMRKPRPMRASPGWRVAVVTTVIPGAEPLDMLEETLRALVGLDYPHDTWVLDEEDDEQVKALCRKLGARHFSRKPMARYQTETGTFKSRSKHGNYNAWLYEIGFERYDIITAFDPDHVPRADFLSKVLGYFDDPTVGYVQAAQVYYNQDASFIARGAAEETYAYYSSVQMASYGLDYPIIIGCHNTHRVAALKQVGGFAAHDADDLLITLLYRSRTWQGVYVPEVLARGLTPVDWSGYLIQQRRWARSVLDIKLRVYRKLKKNISLKTRVMSFLHGFNYLYRSLIIFAGFLLTLYMLSTGHAPRLVSLVIAPKLGLLFLVLLLCDFYRQRFYLDPQSERGLHWRAALLHFAKWPWTLLAFCEVICNRRVAYALTPKVKPGSRRLLLFWPQLSIAILISASWLVGMAFGRITEPLLHAWAAVAVAGSLALGLTDFMRFPDPYDRKLAPSPEEREDEEELILSR